MSEHTLHSCDEPECLTCTGGLAHCIVCRGAEGSLPTDCPGVRMSDHQEQFVMDGMLNYRGGRWRAESNRRRYEEH